jgi:hypothetical protein
VEFKVSVVQTLYSRTSTFNIPNSFTRLILIIFIGSILRGLFVYLTPKVTRFIFVPPTSHANLPLTVLISTADTDAGEMDFWIHRIVSYLGRPIDVQVIDDNKLAIVDDSIIVTLRNLQRWTDLKVKSGFQNVGLLRVGE